MSGGWRTTVPAVSYKADGVHRQQPVHPVPLFRIYLHLIFPSRYRLASADDIMKEEGKIDQCLCGIGIDFSASLCYSILRWKKTEEITFWKERVKMKKILSAIAFVSIAMITGSIVSYAVNRSSVEVPDEAQEKQASFSCTVSGCTQTEAHMHGLCGINGCTLTGEHSHGRCNIAGCTETAAHMHDGAYCYPHTADDGSGNH